MAENENDKNKVDVFSNNGIWVRWAISVILGLGSVGTCLFFMGKWTATVESQMLALAKQDSETSDRIAKIENTGSAPLQMKVLSLEKDYETIMTSLQENARSHTEMMAQLRVLAATKK